jgi:hypothetical protein
MSERARIATSLLAGAAIAVIAALLVIGASAGSSATGCGAATDRTYLARASGLARRINVGESTGGAVKRALYTISSDRTLATAVAADDIPAVASEVRVLVFNHEHIVRLRVLRGGVVIDDLGGPFVLAPVSGSLRVDGRLVGTFVMSIQDDAGYRKLAERLVGAAVVMRYRGHTVMSDVAAGDAPLPARGSVAIDGVHYLVASFSDRRFPSGTLRIWLLLRPPPPALARSSCAQIDADVLAAVAQRAYAESLSGPPVAPALSTLRLDQALPQELEAGDDPGAARIVRGMVAGGGFARLRVSVDGHVIADAGPPVAALGPLRQAIRDSSGHVLASALFSVQSARGYVILTQALTAAPVLVRSASRQLAGSFRGPAKLPLRGPVTYRGVRYVLASFAATAFPTGAVRVYVFGRV